MEFAVIPDHAYRTAFEDDPARLHTMADADTFEDALDSITA